MLAIAREVDDISVDGVTGYAALDVHTASALDMRYVEVSVRIRLKDDRKALYTAPIKSLAAIINRADPTTPHLPGIRSPEETMNQLKTVALHSAAWLGAFCAVLISPVILLYVPPMVVTAVSDIVRAVV